MFESSINDCVIECDEDNKVYLSLDDIECICSRLIEEKNGLILEKSILIDLGEFKNITAKDFIDWFTNNLEESVNFEDVIVVIDEIVSNTKLSLSDKYDYLRLEAIVDNQIYNKINLYENILTGGYHDGLKLYAKNTVLGIELSKGIAIFCEGEYENSEEVDEYERVGDTNIFSFKDSR